jgi:hypothetical protein
MHANEEPRTKNKERTAKVLYVRVTKAELAAAHAAARELNLSIQSWTRRQLGLESRRGYPYRLGHDPSTKNEEPGTNATRMSTDEPPTAPTTPTTPPESR